MCTKLWPMNLCRLALCLTLLAPSLGFAQTPDDGWSPYTPTEPAPSTPPPLVPAEPPALPAGPAPPTPQGALTPRKPSSEVPSGGRAGLRLVAAPFSGIAGAMGGSMAGVIISGIFLLPFCIDALSNPDRNPGCVVSFFASASLGATLGATGCVYLTGRVLGGRGQFLPSLAGALVGATLGAASGTASSNMLVLLLGLGAGPIIGSIVGYEISHALIDESITPSRKRHTGFEMFPIFSAKRGGELLGGLAGRF
jgi:hypothetical protein